MDKGIVFRETFRGYNKDDVNEYIKNIKLKNVVLLYIFCYNSNCQLTWRCSSAG